MYSVDFYRAPIITLLILIRNITVINVIIINPVIINIIFIDSEDGQSQCFDLASIILVITDSLRF